MADLSRPRSSSISKFFKERAARIGSRFNADDAAKLQLELRAIDSFLRSTPIEQHHQLNLNALASRDAAQGTTTEEDGSSNLLELVGENLRPDLIPATFIEAYTSALRGRFYINESRCSDFTKGRDPTPSQVRELLPTFDKALGTSLRSHFDAVNERVPPFRFLDLPTELRLQVYSYLLPRSTHLSIHGQPSERYRPPRRRLDILRTCRKLHDEVTKHVYYKQTLFCKIPYIINDILHSPTAFTAACKTGAIMSPRTRLFFHKLEIQMDYLWDMGMGPQTIFLSQEVQPGIQQVLQLLKLLPNLNTVLVAFPMSSQHADRNDNSWFRPICWLIDSIPTTVQMLWDFGDWDKDKIIQAVAEKMEARGGLQRAESISYAFKSHRTKERVGPLLRN